MLRGGTCSEHRGRLQACSELLSLHCPQHQLLLALLPACASSQVFNCQGITAYAMETLQTTCLNGVSHQHAMQDVASSATLHHPAPREAIGDWILPARFALAQARASKSAPSQGALALDSNTGGQALNTLLWIPFGDHPLKLERYRED